MSDRPLFSSLAAALTWAFCYTPSVIEPSLMVRMMARSRNEDVDEASPPPVINPELDAKPAGLDATAQVAMIQSFVIRMPAIEAVHLVAKYSRGEQRLEARRVMRDLVLPLLDSMVRPRYQIYRLVCRYYGARVALRELADSLLRMSDEDDRTFRHRSWRDIRRLDSQVVGWLKDVATKAEERAYIGLKQTGVIA